MLEIVSLQPIHKGALKEFFVNVVSDGFEQFFHPHGFSEADAERISEYQGMDRYYAVFHNGSVIAYGMLRGWDQGFTIPSVGLAVSKSYQGRGVGTMLLHFLHTAASISGSAKVRLTVTASNQRAIQLYNRLGYELVMQDSGVYAGLMELPSMHGAD